MESPRGMVAIPKETYLKFKNLALSNNYKTVIEAVTDAINFFNDLGVSPKELTKRNDYKNKLDSIESGMKDLINRQFGFLKTHEKNINEKIDGLLKLVDKDKAGKPLDLGDNFRDLLNLIFYLHNNIFILLELNLKTLEYSRVGTDEYNEIHEEILKKVNDLKDKMDYSKHYDYAHKNSQSKQP